MVATWFSRVSSWFGKFWTVIDLIKYEFDVEFDVS